VDENVARDLDRSRRAFEAVVWPEIVRYVGGGTLRSLETGENDLDRTGGIDAYQLLRTGIRTIAQRTQFVDDYRKPATFTIRYSRRRNSLTEFQKRYDAINQGFDVPGLVIQAYVHEQRQQFIRAAIVHGRPFYEYVIADARRWQTRENREDGAVFLVVPWSSISIDNARDRSEVPLLAKDGIGVVHRTPDSFFGARDTVFDRNPIYFSHRQRNSDLLWI
jgi:hypothetical protein